MANFLHEAGDALRAVLHTVGDEVDKLLAELRHDEKPAEDAAKSAVTEAVHVAEQDAASAADVVK